MKVLALNACSPALPASSQREFGLTWLSLISPRKRSWGFGVVLALSLVSCTRTVVVRDSAAAVEEWPTYGNDPGSSRYSPLSEITKANVRNLKVAWMYRTGDMSDGTSTWNGQKVSAKSTFEATPLMADGTLYIATAFNRIIALDAETGNEKS